jgi:hypothetical protein
MSIWIEIHCDVGVAENCPYCKTFMNNNPGILTANGRQAMMDQLYSLERYAKKKGWLKTHDGRWICPNCAKEMP